MEKPQCIGCRTSFQDGEELSQENNEVEFRMESVPFKEDSVKWSIVKAIISFLNSKGGTIYVGIESKKGKVQGLFLEHKERDSFKLTLKQLT